MEADISQPFLIQHSRYIINYLLIFVIPLCIVNMFINYRTLKDNLVYGTSLMILFFIINMLVFNHMDDNRQIGFMPVLAFFGPLFFMHIKVINGEIISYKILWHLLLPLFFFLAYIYLVLTTVFDDVIYSHYLLIFIVGISTFIYGIYGLISKPYLRYYPLMDMASIGGVAFITISIFVMLTSFSAMNTDEFDPHHFNFTNIIHYSIFAIFSLIYFFCTISVMLDPGDIPFFNVDEKFSGEDLNRINSNELEGNTDVFSPSYSKVRLTDIRLIEYEQKLKQIMESERLFLQKDLTLSILAKKMQVSKHHLTQVLNLQIGFGFYQYINRARIFYALDLIEVGSVELEIEELVLKCGFNNRVSFNRYFKEVTGTQPSIYIKNVHSS